MPASRLLAVVLGCLALGVSAAGADWLVMRDGSRVETKGPWRVEGAKVLFDLPNGTLSVLRASEVDFDATEAANAPPPAPVEAPAAPRAKPEPVLVITDKDVPRAAPEDTTIEAEATTSSTSTVTVSEPLVVEAWEKTSTRDGFGVEIRGTVSNRGGTMRAGVVLAVQVEDLDGGEHKADAFLRSSALEPGGRTTFRAVFPNITDIAETPLFRLDSIAVAADADGVKVLDAESGAVRQTIRSVDGAAGSSDDSTDPADDADFDGADGAL